MRGTVHDELAEASWIIDRRGHERDGQDGMDVAGLERLSRELDLSPSQSCL